jgi:KDO2-lipid IV(A) lauroyltransferase
VTKRLSVGPLDSLWQRLRAARGLQLLEEGAAAGSAARALGRGELVAMMIDQAPERERGAIRLPFLGEAAWVDLAPALCALRSRSPLVVAFPRRLDDGTHDVEIAAVLTPPARARRAWAVEATAEATRLLEAFVRRNPDQWLWMHRRWKEGQGSVGRPAKPAPAVFDRKSRMAERYGGAEEDPRLAGARL